MASSTSPLVCIPVSFFAVTNANAQFAYIKSMASRLSVARRSALASARLLEILDLRSANAAKTVAAAAISAQITSVTVENVVFSAQPPHDNSLSFHLTASNGRTYTLFWNLKYPNYDFGGFPLRAFSLSSDG